MQARNKCKTPPTEPAGEDTQHVGPAIPVSALGGATEIAILLGVRPNTINQWRTRYPDTFPSPLVELTMGPVWDLRAVEQWARHTKRWPE